LKIRRKRAISEGPVEQKSWSDLIKYSSKLYVQNGKIRVRWNLLSNLKSQWDRLTVRIHRRIKIITFLKAKEKAKKELKLTNNFRWTDITILRRRLTSKEIERAA